MLTAHYKIDEIFESTSKLNKLLGTIENKEKVKNHELITHENLLKLTPFKEFVINIDNISVGKITSMIREEYSTNQ
jgi:hypothetical protein